MSYIPFQVIDWNIIDNIEYKGETGAAFWKTINMEGLRLRIVTYDPGYLADHWCSKGHFVHCIAGEFTTEMENGEVLLLKEGMSYIVSDELSSHRSSTKDGVKLLIVDGDFLKLTTQKRSLPAG